MNFTTTHIRSEKVTIDTRIYTILNGRKKPGEVYLAAIAPDMELTVITLDEVSDMRLLSQRIPTENTFIITLSTTPLHWTAPENSGIFCCPGWRCSD